MNEEMKLLLKLMLAQQEEGEEGHNSKMTRESDSDEGIDLNYSRLCRE